MAEGIFTAIGIITVILTAAFSHHHTWKNRLIHNRESYRRRPFRRIGKHEQKTDTCKN
jgi:hypothetical protein